MCDQRPSPTPMPTGPKSAEDAQRLISEAGRIDLEVDHVPLAKATGRILAPDVDPHLRHLHPNLHPTLEGHGVQPPGAGSFDATGAGYFGSALAVGTRLAANHLPVLAGLGQPTVNVYRRLRVGVLTAGSNWVAPGAPTGDGQRYNLAGPMLCAMLDTLGTQSLGAPHAGVDERALRSTLDMLLAECSVVVIAGCMQSAQHGSIRRALLERGGELGLVRVRSRPAAIIGLARLGRKLVVCLPGGLTSTSMAFVLYVSPLIRRLQGRADYMPSVCSGILTEAGISAAGAARHHDEFVWAGELTLPGLRKGLALQQPPTDREGAAEVMGRATGLALLRPGEPLHAGTSVPYYAFAHWLR